MRSSLISSWFAMSDTPIAAPNPDDFKSFTEVAAGLPGIKGRIAQRDLSELIMEMVRQNVGHTEYGGCVVTTEDLNELFRTGYRGGYEREGVSPAGARILVRLYLANALPMKPHTYPSEISADVLEYCDGEAALIAKEQQRWDEDVAYRAKILAPENIHESEFTWTLLNAVFWAAGKKVRDMEIGGIAVHKQVSMYFSNSRETHEFKASFFWTSSDGKAMKEEGYSKFESNRANDPHRNWGLPE